MKEDNTLRGLLSSPVLDSILENVEERQLLWWLLAWQEEYRLEQQRGLHQLVGLARQHGRSPNVDKLEACNDKSRVDDNLA